LLLLGIKTNKVFADEGTPTPNWQPFYETQAPGEFINNECPDGVPAGYLTKTPSPLWLMYCAQCLPPEGSDYDWGESPEWVDPTPTLIYPTPRPTEYPDNEDVLFSSSTVDSFKAWGTGDYVNDFDFEVDYVFEEVDASGSETSTYRGFDSNLQEDDKDYSFYFHLNLDKYKTACTTIYCSHYGKYRLRFKNYAADNVNVKIYVAGLEIWNEDISYYSTKLFDMEEFGQCEVVDFYRDMYIAVEVQGSHPSASDFQFRDETYLQSFCGLHYRRIAFMIIPGSYDPDPGDSNCDEIQEENDPGGGGDGEDYFDVPGFYYGDPICFSVPTITIPMGWLYDLVGLTISDIVWDGFSVCFIPIGFGSLTVFGLSMDLDTMAGLMAAVLLIRLITRS
jgi:hypothetical protein